MRQDGCTVLAWRLDTAGAMLAGIRPRSLRSVSQSVPPILDRTSHPTAVEIVGEDGGYLPTIVAAMPEIGCLDCAGHLSRRDYPQHPGRRSRPPVAGSQTSQRRQASGHIRRHQPWLVQLDGPSGHTLQRAGTLRTRLKSGRSAVRPRP